jgi:voltage-gated potassium channel
MADRQRESRNLSPVDVARRRLKTTLILLLALTVIGTVGFKLVSTDPKVSWIDCLYMTITSMTTVGYGEIVPLATEGRLFVIAFLITGFGVVSFGAVEIGQWVFSADARKFLERRKMDKKILQLKDHYIVCGFGKMGWTICEHLHERGRPFVVIDTDEKLLLHQCAPQQWLFVVGDASDDLTLARAGISRAKALAAVLPTDADNVFVTLTARLLSGKISIIARATDDSASLKLERAGASRVVSPYSTGAQKIARFMLNPNIEDFLEIADNTGKDLELADVEIPAYRQYVGMKLNETHLRDEGVMIVGIRRKSGERLMPPPGNAVIQAGDCLYAFGSIIAVNRMISEASQEGEEQSGGSQSIEFRN